MADSARSKSLVLSFILILLASLCGCSTNRLPAGSGVKDGAAVRDSLAPGPCPGSLPAAASACSQNGLVCEYGQDPRPACRSTAHCGGGTWGITAPKCQPLPGVTCPATRAAAAGKVCSPKDAYCSYPGDLVCHCTNCTAYPLPQCSGPLKWRCAAPHKDTECPQGKPRLGVPCTIPGKKCDYECGSGGARLCSPTFEAWTSAQGTPCPVSTRRVKRDISYLTPGQTQAISRRLLKVKLATYRYTDPALGQGKQLGFILEDVGQSFAGDPARGQVNLYGYSSMLLATVQAQQRSIEQLQSQLRAVSATLKEMKTSCRR